MTRKHFELIARTIKDLRVDDETRYHIAKRFGAELREQNPRFNELTFQDACGIPDEIWG